MGQPHRKWKRLADCGRTFRATDGINDFYGGDDFYGSIPEA
jgi:hypothetical protein